MNGGSSIQEFPTYVKQTSKKPSLLLIVFIFILLLVIIALVGLYFLGNKTKNSAFQMTPTPTQAVSPTEIPTTTATPAASLTPSPPGKTTPTLSKTTSTIDISKLDLAVLNGSGQPGAANGIATKLKNLGYTISVIGNADNFSYTGITIKIKTSANKYLSQLKKDVTASAGGATVSTITDDTIKTDVQVIIGQ